MRGRIRASADAFETRAWRDDLKQWDDVDKPRALKAHQELLAADPGGMTDDALLAHLAQLEKHLEDMLFLHHRYTITSTVPVGDLLAHASAWTGKSAGEILDLLRGSTPMSLGVSASELKALVTALEADPAALAVLDGKGDASSKIAALRKAAGAAGEASRAFFDLVWHRAVSYDLGEKSCGEMPDMLLASIVAAKKAMAAKIDTSAEKAKALRALVPELHRAQFDQLLDEARVINRLRDERGLYADCLALGIARRAVLETGKRLAAKGKLDAADHAVDVSLQEMRGLFAGAIAPSPSEVTMRVTWRRTKTVADIPQHLNGAPSGPPPVDLLPEAARRAARAVDAVLGNLFAESQKKSTETVVHGISVNEGVYEGTARVVNEASEFDRLKQGDVLVARSTAPYFNVVLPLLGAIVTDRGGQLSHAAIVAREFGIPGVVGTKDGTRLIPDGARVVVDGTKGEIRVVSRLS